MLADLRARIDDYNDLAESVANYLSLEARAPHYGEGDRAGKTLAFMTHTKHADSYTAVLLAEDGTAVRSTADVSCVLVAYYESLYHPGSQWMMLSLLRILIP